MASKVIKGLTVEIGGDTTKLGKALEGVEKQSRNLSSELGEINKLLKFDPGNTELLAQKQKVLGDAVANTREKLNTLKEAEKQVQAQFEKGEASEEQVRALQREIISATKKLDGYEKAAQETAQQLEKLGDSSDEVVDGAKKTEKGADNAADALDEMADSADKAGDASDGLGSKLGSIAKGGLQLLTAGVTAAIGALVGAAESSREYRTEMGKLDTAFTTAGHSSEAATETYKSLQGVLGETDQAVEAANHLAQLADNEQDLATWTDICTGVYATFGASLPIEGLTEAANETAKTGALTGSLADALNWAGVNEEAFQAQLDACSTEQERQALITETLNGLYAETAEKYRETNAELIRANEANEAWNASMAEVGAAVEPILTDVKLLGASLISDLLPGIQGVAEGFRGMLNGDEGAAAEMGAQLSGIFEQLLTKITELLPQVAEMAVSLVSTLTSSLVGMLPQLVDVGLQIIESLLSGIGEAIPEVVASVSAMIPELVAALQTNLPLLLQSAVDLVSSLISMLSEQLPVLIPILLDTIVSLVNLIVGQLPVLIPQLVSLLVSVIQLLAQQLPVLIPLLVEALVSIVTILTEQLPVIIPMLIDACILIVGALIEALPDILVALTEALPEMLQAVWDAIVMVFQNLPDWFGQLFSGAFELIQAAWSAVGEFFSGIWTNITNTFSSVGSWFGTAFSNAWTSVKNAWSGAKNFFSGIWSSIKKSFSSVGSWFKDTFSKAWQAVKNVFSTGGKVFEGIKDGIADVFKTVVNAIIRGINKVISVPFDKINGILTKIKNLSIAGAKPFSGIISTLPVPSIPELEHGTVLEKGQVGLLEGKGAEAVVPLERNKKWINRVAHEFLAQVKNVAGADIMQRGTQSVMGTGAAGSSLEAKLDSILAAIERGQVLLLDGEALVGATADRMDNALGIRRTLAARGAL
jgi:phage-related minor tail protein